MLIGVNWSGFQSLPVLYGTKTFLHRLETVASSEPDKQYKLVKSKEFPTEHVSQIIHLGLTDHGLADCPYKSVLPKAGHIQAVCLKKWHTQPVKIKIISKHLIQTEKIIVAIPQLEQAVLIQGKQFVF